MSASVSPPPDQPTPDSASPEPPAIAAPPDFSPIQASLADASRTAFKYANRCFVVPVHRAGLAVWMGSPLTGWQCLVTTIGRRSGLPRHTPLGYLVAEGAAWVLAGYGPTTLWYRNILEDPRVTLLLPGRPPIAAHATEERDSAVRARIIPALARSMALPGSVIGYFPRAAADERILESLSWVPLVRIAPADGSALAAGPEDPGGLGWIWRQVLAIGGTIVACRALMRWLRR